MCTGPVLSCADSEEVTILIPDIDHPVGNRCSTVEEGVTAAIRKVVECCARCRRKHDDVIALADHQHTRNLGHGSQDRPISEAVLPEKTAVFRVEGVQAAFTMFASNSRSAASDIEGGTIPGRRGNAAVTT